jgi:hypothetical protein
LDENSSTGALPVVLVVEVLEKFSIMFFSPTFKELGCSGFIVDDTEELSERQFLP